nr:hypothetical protein [Klebsiella variicola]
MMSALINALCYKRARGELLLSQRTIQKNMSLPAMAALYVEAKKNGWHSEGYAALESYLENTPGFLLANAEYPETWEARAFEQHNYMSRQFLKTLSCSMKLMAMFSGRQRRYPDGRYFPQ